MRRGVRGVLLAAAVLGSAVACSSPAAKPSHPASAASGTTSAGAAVAATPNAGQAPVGLALWPGASWQFGPLPANPLYAKLVTTDRDFQMGIYDAIYARGRSDRYASYISDAQVLESVQKNVAEQVAEHRGYTGVERYYRTSVRPFPKVPDSYVVDFCVNDSAFRPTNALTGRVVPRPAGTLTHYEEQDVYAKAGGRWKINTIDVFDAASGYSLMPGTCY